MKSARGRNQQKHASSPRPSPSSDEGEGEEKHHGAAVSPGFLRAQADGLLLAVKLQPRVSANEILGALGGELRIKVTAPPVDSAANEALLRLLAETLDCSRSQVELVRGHTSRHKVVKLHGLKMGAVLAKLNHPSGGGN